MNSSRATPEFFGCGVLDHDPEAIDEPRATYWATTGPRQTSGTLVTNGMGTVFRYSGTAYAAGGVATPDPYQGGTCHQLMTGEVLTAPLDVVDAAYTFLGRQIQALIVDSACAFDSDVTVPIDDGVTGTFRVVGLASYVGLRAAWRKA